MQLELFKKMILEEYRLHSSFFGGRLFALFPVIIFLLFFLAASQLRLFSSLVSLDVLFQSIHFIFLFLGVSIGAFGLYGKEIMNRRFGQASLLAYSSRSLPLSERTIFFNFFLKDIVYYLLLWVFPILTGIFLGGLLASIPLTVALFGSITLILTFLLGLSLVFFLSTIYAHSNRLLIFLLLSTLIGIVFLKGYYQVPLSSLFITYILFYAQTTVNLALTFVLIIVPTSLSLIFVKVEYPQKKKQYENTLNPLDYKLNFTKNYSFYISKDFIDLHRSEGGLGKILFQFLLPVLFTWMFLYIFTKIIPDLKIIMIFSIFLGVVSSSLYNMLTAFDTFDPYMFLPVQVSTIIKSKLIGYMLLNIISILILIAVAISVNEVAYLLASFCAFITLSFYCLSTTVYFTGLHPTILMYNSKIFLQYILATAPLLFLFTIASIVQPMSLYISPILLLPTLFILKKSYMKWDNWTPLTV
jgi:hypothetical protein